MGKILFTNRKNSIGYVVSDLNIGHLSDRFLYENAIDPRRVAISEAHAIELMLGESPFKNPVRVSTKSPTWKAERQNSLRTLVKDSLTYNPLLEKTIENSKFILLLPENWDEEGSPCYSEETWKRATQFIRRTVFQFKQESGNWIISPKITPSHEGSIDIRWKIGERSLLINFPDNNISPSYFGSDKKNDSVKGTLNLSSQNSWILKWLTR